MASDKQSKGPRNKIEGPLPKIPKLRKRELLSLVRIFARLTLLPHPKTVRAFNGEPVFLTVRNAKKRRKIKKGIMFDDNTTPRWALGWAHGHEQVWEPKGWTVAHVWDRNVDSAYTNLANLALVPEFLGSLTDKEGPLAPYLRYHSYKKYGWKPKADSKPDEPPDYIDVRWNYFKHEKNPKNLVYGMLKNSGDKRAKILCRLNEMKDMFE